MKDSVRYHQMDTLVGTSVLVTDRETNLLCFSNDKHNR